MILRIENTFERRDCRVPRVFGELATTIGNSMLRLLIRMQSPGNRTHSLNSSPSPEAKQGTPWRFLWSTSLISACQFAPARQ